MTGQFKGLPICDQVQVRVLMDNAVDEFLPAAPGIERFSFIRPGYEELPLPLRAEHGFSLLVRWQIADRDHALLFDFGLSADGLAENLRALGEDLTEVEALALSHGHWDHFGGLAMLPFHGRHTPFYHGPEAFRERRIGPSGREVNVGRINQEWLERLSLVACEVAQPQEILPGALLAGRIPRETAFEGATGPFQVKHGDKWGPDYLPGEMALIMRTQRGLLVISGCAHAGIVNTVLYARRLTGEKKVHAVLGGFHLVTSSSEVIDRTIRCIADIDPDVVLPMHCTGNAASIAIAKDLEGAYRVSVVGTTLHFPLLAAAPADAQAETPRVQSAAP
jgi:7,8-dihydropterin-6-yl-methyl-4-(beta-D-ribofuranosyl)aminobenzene 5'-phosphate synthase